MNALQIYFIVYGIMGSLSMAPQKGTRCWEMIGDCQWGKSQAICARTYGDAAQYLQQNSPRCQLGVEKTFPASGFRSRSD